MSTVTLVTNTSKATYEPSGFQRRPTFTVEGTVGEHGSDHSLYAFSIVIRESGEWEFVWVEATDFAFNEDGDEIEEYAAALTTVIRNQIVIPICTYWERRMMSIVDFVNDDELHILRGLV